MKVTFDKLSYFFALVLSLQVRKDSFQNALDRIHATRNNNSNQI